MTKAMIIFNPDSGDGESKALAEFLNGEIRQDYETITMKASASGGDVTNLAKQAAQEKYDAVFLLGGDGTVNLAVNGLIAEAFHPVVGIIPTGTVNNFARMLNIPMEGRRAAEQLKTAETKEIEIGKFNDSYFLSSVSAGKIPDTAREVSSEEKDKLGPLAYVKEGLEALNEDETTLVRLTLDDKEVVEEAFSIIVATTGRSVFGWENFFPKATLQDGKINVMGLKESTTGEKISLLPELISESDEYSDLLFSTSCHKIKVEPLSVDSLPTTVDGNDGANFPGTIEVGGHLPFFVLPEE